MPFDPDNPDAYGPDEFHVLHFDPADEEEWPEESARDREIDELSCRPVPDDSIYLPQPGDYENDERFGSTECEWIGDVPFC